MRLCPALLICCLLLPNLFSQDSLQAPGAATRTPLVVREEKEFNFFPGGKIEIAIGAAGSLKVIGWQKGSIRMEAEKIVYYPAEEQPKAEPPQIPIKVRYGQTSASIKTPLNPEANAEVNLTVYVPGYRTDVTARLRTGDFSIEGVNGWVEVTITAEGSIDTKSLSGYFSGRTMRGDISVAMDNSRWNGLEFGANTQNGAIKLELPVKYSASLQLQTQNGKISVDYPPQVVEGEEVPPEIVSRKTAQVLKLAVGDGGAPIKLITASGDVSLSKKE
jgi:hypothetical protein